MPTITIVAALLFAFGCKKTEKQTPIRQPTATNVQKQAEMEVTKENMDKQLEKVEKKSKRMLTQRRLWWFCIGRADFLSSCPMSSVIIES